MTDDEQWLAAQDRAVRRLHRTLVAHPNPRDPDYPLDDEGDDEEGENHELDR